MGPLWLLLLWQLPTLISLTGKTMASLPQKRILMDASLVLLSCLVFVARAAQPF